IYKHHLKKKTFDCHSLLNLGYSFIIISHIATTSFCEVNISHTFVFLILSPAQSLNCSEPTNLALLEALTPVFDLRFIRPVNNFNNYTEVYVSFTMYGILGVGWKNEFISWDPEQCGTDHITLPRRRFWIPDMVMNELVSKNTAPFVPYVHVYSDGMIYDYSPVRVVSTCRLNIYTFPFDVQNCTFTFVSYSHKTNDIMVELNRPIEEIIKKTLAVMTTIGLRRKSTLYVVNLLIPSCSLITVDLFSFLLPPQSVDRSAFKMTLILGYTVFLLLMNDLLPVTGNTIPLINVFFALCLALMVASLLETILITHLYSSSSRFAPVPRWVREVVLQKLGCCVGLPPKPTKDHSDMSPNAVREEIKAGKTPPMPLELEDTTPGELRKLGRDLRAIRLQLEQQLSGDQKSEEWIQVASIIDRFLFGLYTLFISVSSITMIWIWVESDRR
ncbi:5-hydroxytryptamine receptor 3E-like, partial [Gadus morhua]|uniref:5-hydroxytryptamine receptor 3E-like n=1 Tax=Gadus morhua TaxID=8049 RepID=UPI0011B84D00